MLMMESVSHPLNKIRYSSVGVILLYFVCECVCTLGCYRPGFHSISLKSRQEEDFFRAKNESAVTG